MLAVPLPLEPLLTVVPPEVLTAGAPITALAAAGTGAMAGRAAVEGEAAAEQAPRRMAIAGMSTTARPRP
jgi:hypothetical protein